VRLRVILIDGTTVQSVSDTYTASELAVLERAMGNVLEQRESGWMKMETDTGERCWIPSSQIALLCLTPDSGEGLEPLDEKLGWSE